MLASLVVVVVVALVAAYFVSPWFRQHVHGWTVTALTALGTALAAWLQSKGFGP